jgi:putative thioredoxin
VPYVFLLVDGRPQPLIQDVLSLDNLRTAVNQVMQQLTAQGLTGRHQPRQMAPAAGAEGEDGEPPLDPRYAPAQDALGSGDYDTAVAEYEKLLKANPADAEAAAGLAMARVLQRTDGVDPAAARAAADAAPDDVDAQTLAADLDLLEGKVDEAFSRLVDLVRRTSDDDRNKTREHLLGLFNAVGNEDPRVLDGRRALASALF